MNCLVISLSVVIVLFAFVNSAVIYKSKPYRLDIVHYNDFHARFQETSVTFPICTSNNNSCIGGFARLYYEITELLKQKPNALVLDAGDTFQGSFWYTLLKWNITQKYINLLPNDAHAIGNHEFDDGVAGLAPYLKAMKAPVVAANINVTLEPLLEGLTKPHIIVEKNGRKIGIIGLITPTTAELSNPEKVIFLDPVKSAKAEAEELTKQGIDIIILLSHCGLNVDKEIAKKVGDNIDIIIGGHSHSLLWNNDTSPTDEVISGPYPVLVATALNPRHKVLIVTASAFTKYLGNLTTYFDDKGNLLSYDGEPVFLGRDIPEDVHIKKMLEETEAELRATVNKVVGKSNSDFLEMNCGSQECELGNLVAESFLDAAKEKKVTNLPKVALLYRNNIKGGLAKGDVTVGAVMNALPFSNKVVSMIVKGKHLTLIFQHSVSTHWVKKPFAGPFLVQFAGAKAVLNATEQKVFELSIKEGDKLIPVDPEKDYEVILLSFMAYGGNGLKFLKQYAHNITIIGGDRFVLQDYIHKSSPLNSVLDNRLTVYS